MFLVPGVVLAASFLYRPGSMPAFSFCTFKHLTGVPCLLCGMTRSFCAMAQGQVANAFRLHPAGPIIFLAFAAAFVVGLRDLFAQQSLLCGLARATAFSRVWPWLLLAASIPTVARKIIEPKSVKVRAGEV